MVNVCVQHFNVYKLPKSKLTNANILCLIQFSSGQNKLVQLLIGSRNSGGLTIGSLSTAARSTILLVNRRSSFFSVAAATLWNTLPVDVQSSPSLPVFHQRLKTFLFHKSFRDVWRADYAFVDLVMAYCYFSHVKNFLIDWLILRRC